VLGVSVRVLERLDELIEGYGLHRRGVEPVDVGPLLEEFSAGYRPLPNEVAAVAVKWKVRGQRFVRVAYHPDLMEERKSAKKRHAQAHEYAHSFRRHRGYTFVMWMSAEETQKVGLWDRHEERRSFPAASGDWLPSTCH